MILTEEVEVKVNKKNIEHYENLGYETNNKVIIIKTEDLIPGSNLKIKVKCDKCGLERQLSFCFYIKNTKFLTEDYCCSRKCSQEKIKKTCLEKYGVDNPSKMSDFKDKVKETNKDKYGTEYYSQTEEFKERYKETCLDKYGCDNVFQNKDIKEKSKKTCLEKYGKVLYSKTEEFKERYKETCLEKYGTENTFGNSDIKEKSKKTCLEKYNEEYYSKTTEFIEKVKNTNNIKYGCDYYSQTIEFKERYKETCLERYGYDFATKSQIVKDKILKTKIKRGWCISKELKNEYVEYEYKSRLLSNQHKRIILYTWDGIDYIDGEYIKDNFELYNSNDESYPNLDHKISIKEGFLLGITIEEISDISNLAFTKRKHNSSKNTKTLEQYLKEKEELN